MRTGSTSTAVLDVITASPNLTRRQAADRLPEEEICALPTYIAMGVAVTLAAAFTLALDSLTLKESLETIAEACTAPLANVILVLTAVSVAVAEMEP